MPADNSAIDPIDPVGPLADEFIARHRRGERPAVADYAERYPELAERIKQLFPMLLAMEEAGADPSLGATVAPAGPTNEWAGPSLDRVAGYRLLREVGRGGMGIVYEAEQVALGRHVALKVLPLHAARGGTGLERFRQEARAAARLHHTNIVPVYEVGQDGDAYFYAMQFIPGQPLDQVLDEVRKLRAASLGRPAPPGASVAHSLLAGLPAPPAPAGDAPAPAPSVSLPGQARAAEDRSARGAYYKSVARLGLQVAQALDYAHREGVIHRDVKPSNLLLDSDGRVWVTDFGLAKTDGSALTQTGDIVGTLRYMAPERFNGWSDPRSDIYALGLTLYEMLSLRPAFDAPEQGRLMQQVLHDEPPALRKADPHVPRDLETMIAKAIDKEPSRRYQTAADFGADLQRFVEDRPILARRIGLTERAWRWGRRNPALAAATALTFAALLIATAVSVWSAEKRRRLSEDLETALHESQKVSAERDQALKETRGHAARSAVDRAQGLMEHGRVHEAMLWLARALELTPGEDGPVQHHARAGLASLEADAPALRAMWVPRHPGPVAAAAFSADGTALLTGSEATEEAPGEARLWDAVNGEPLTDPLPHKGTVTLVAVSPDRKALLTVSTPQAGHWEVRPWDAADGRPLTDGIAHPGPVTFAACGPAGKTFVTVGSQRLDEPPEAHFWQVAGATAEPRTLAHPSGVTALAVSADGKSFFTACSNPGTSAGEIHLWDAATGEPTVTRPFPGAITAAAFAADGGVWLGEDSGGVVVWDAARDTLRPWLHGARGTVRGLALNPAGDYALLQSENVQTGKIESRLWDRFRGQWLGLALPEGAASARAAFSPDGRHTLTWDQRRAVRVWDLDYERRWFAAVPVPAPQGGNAYRTVQYAPDGNTVLSMVMAFQQGATAQLWDANTGTAKGEPVHIGGTVYAVAASPDGRTTLVSGARGMRFWDGATGKPLAPLTEDVVTGRIAFSPDGKTVALANAQRLWLVDVASGRPTGPPFPSPGPLNDLRFAPDGRHLWAVTSASVRCFDAASGREVALSLPVRGRGFHGILPAPGGGNLLAVIDQSGLALWDIRAGSRTDFSIPRWSIPSAVAFTPDGGGLLAPEPSGFGAQLWDVALGKPLGLPIRYPSFFTSASFRPDGRALAAGGGAGVLRLVRLPEPVGPDAEPVTRRVQALAGLELTAAGEVRGLDPSAWRADEARAEGPGPALAWHLRRGLDRIEVGQWDAAVWYFDRQLRERPDDWLALALRARALANLNRLEEAAADFDRSFEKGPPETVFAWHLLAAQQGASFLDEVGDVVGGKPRRAPASVWLIDRLIGRNSHQSARLLAQRARARGRAKQWERAVEDYEHAARLAPDDADLLLEAARACAQHRQPARAADYFAQAAAARPDDASLWLETGRELARLERWDKAAEHFVRALDLLPGGSSVNAPRAQVGLEVARSQPLFERAIRLRPDDPYLWIGRGRYHVERRQWKEAAADFAHVAESSGVEGPAFEYAALLLILGDEAGYRKAAARMIEKAGAAPSPAEAYTLARTCDVAPKSPEPARAVAWAEQAVANRPAAGWYLHVLGLALYRNGNAKEAVARLEESERTGWEPALNWLALALAHHRLGHAEQARKYLGQATELLDKPPATPRFSADVLEGQVLRREAEELIRGRSSGGS